MKNELVWLTISRIICRKQEKTRLRKREREKEIQKKKKTLSKGSLCEKKRKEKSMNKNEYDSEDDLGCEDDSSGSFSMKNCTVH